MLWIIRPAVLLLAGLGASGQTGPTFRGSIEPHSVVAGGSFTILVQYVPWSQEFPQRSDEVSVDGSGLFQVTLSSPVSATDTRVNVRFDLKDSNAKVVANLYLKKTEESQIRANPLDNIIPLTAFGPDCCPFVTPFSVSYTDRQRPFHSILSVSPQDEVFVRGSPVVLNLTLANDSDEMLFVDGYDGEWNYRILLKDAADRDVRQKETPHVERRSGRAVYPGDKITRSVDLTRLFALDSAGAFRLTVQSRVIRWGAGTSEAIMSPEFSFFLYP
jgi:hypothetical protein